MLEIDGRFSGVRDNTVDLSSGRTQSAANYRDIDVSEEDFSYGRRD
jgi:hypothetical protein